MLKRWTLVLVAAFAVIGLTQVLGCRNPAVLTRAAAKRYVERSFAKELKLLRRITKTGSFPELFEDDKLRNKFNSDQRVIGVYLYEETYASAQNRNARPGAFALKSPASQWKRKCSDWLCPGIGVTVNVYSDGSKVGIQYTEYMKSDMGKYRGYMIEIDSRFLSEPDSEPLSEGEVATEKCNKDQ